MVFQIRFGADADFTVGGVRAPTKNPQTLLSSHFITRNPLRYLQSGQAWEDVISTVDIQYPLVLPLVLAALEMSDKIYLIFLLITAGALKRLSL